jgi:hypothetical protein
VCKEEGGLCVEDTSTPPVSGCNGTHLRNKPTCEADAVCFWNDSVESAYRCGDVSTIDNCDEGETEKECKKDSSMNCVWKIPEGESDYKCFGSEVCTDTKHISSESICKDESMFYVYIFIYFVIFCVY